MRLAIVMSAAATLMSSCAPPAPLPVIDACHAQSVSGLIGQPVALLPNSGLWTALRVIGPGDMVTMDYSETRLNVEIDGAGLITALRCG